jgi:peptidoglycan lytic transglycosylase
MPSIFPVRSPEGIVTMSAVKWRRFIWVFALLGVGVVAFGWREQRRERRYDAQIQAAARRYGVDPMLVKAVVWRESRFKPERRGRKGEVGLMQIQEVTAREWADAEHVRSFAHEYCLDPGTNTLAGTFYLGKLLKRYAKADNPVPYALADYNAGRSNVLRWNGGAAATNSAVFIEQIGFPGTRNYVQSVMWHYSFYRFLSRFGPGARSMVSSNGTP